MKGYQMFFLIVGVFVAFFAVLFLGLAALSYSYVNDALDQNITIGDRSLAQYNNDTFGAVVNAFIASVDVLALSVLLGMCVVLVAGGFFLGDNNKYWIPFDVFMICMAFLISIYISQTYDIIISTDLLGDFFVDNLPKSSTFVLNLPTIVATLGALIMIATYATTRRKQPEVLGY